LCAEIQKQVPEFVYLEAAIGTDPDQRNYIVSNARIRATGFEPEWTLAAGIAELIKGCRLMPPSPWRNR
jgi:nucleoside-diphosphate-sugar epimerase